MNCLLFILDYKAISEEPVHEHLNIGYLVSSVRHLPWVTIAIETCYIDNLETCALMVEDAVKKHEPDVVGFPVYQFNIDAFKLLTKQIKVISDRIVVVAGNVEISMNPSYYMESLPELDYAMVDEGHMRTLKQKWKRQKV